MLSVKSYLSYDLLIGLSRHVRMGPGMHGQVTALFQNGQELLGIIEDVDTNKEVRGGLLLLREELQKLRCALLTVFREESWGK